MRFSKCISKWWYINNIIKNMYFNRHRI